MKLRSLLFASVALWAGTFGPACGGAGDAPAGDGNDDEGVDPATTTIPGPAVDTGEAAAPDDPAAQAAAAAAEPKGEPAVPPAPAVQCSKHLTVIFTVGVPGTSKMKTNGCWKPVIADGAASAQFRKCSTSSFAVQNGSAPSWAYDDTNPQHALTQEKNFLASCSNGSTGDGYVYMAYRGGWRILGAPHLRAYFAELYGSALTDVDSLWFVSGVYKNNAGLASRKDVFPMINFGPPLASKLDKKVKTDTLAICKTVANNGYVGMYNASWREGMAATDPRLLAIESALDDCTKK